MASTRRSAATRSSLCAASKTAVTATVVAAPLNACDVERTSSRSHCSIADRIPARRAGQSSRNA
jgi:hypothetical protein